MAFERGHAIVIGVGTHKYEPAMDVPVTVADAEAVASVLRDANACGYLAGQVQFVHDDGATKSGILTALDELAAHTGKDDTVFLFYCGHGALGNDGNYYLFSHDAQLARRPVRSGNGRERTGVVGQAARGQGVPDADDLQRLSFGEHLAIAGGRAGSAKHQQSR